MLSTCHFELNLMNLEQITLEGWHNIERATRHIETICRRPYNRRDVAVNFNY